MNFLHDMTWQIYFCPLLLLPIMHFTYLWNLQWHRDDGGGSRLLEKLLFTRLHFSSKQNIFFFGTMSFETWKSPRCFCYFLLFLLFDYVFFGTMLFCTEFKTGLHTREAVWQGNIAVVPLCYIYFLHVETNRDKDFSFSIEFLTFLMLFFIWIELNFRLHYCDRNQLFIGVKMVFFFFGN